MAFSTPQLKEKRKTRRKIVRQTIVLKEENNDESHISLPSERLPVNGLFTL